MRRAGFALLITAGLVVSAQAAFLEYWEGETTITADAAPVRDRYPEGAIIGILHKDDIVDVGGAAGDGRGYWVEVQSKADTTLRGYVADDQTTFWQDIQSGRLKQPQTER